MLETSPANALHVIPSPTLNQGDGPDGHVPMAQIPDHIESIADFEGIKSRFSSGFKTFIESQKRLALMELLHEELPRLAQNEDFVDNVMARLDHTIFSEDRYVFLSVNPKFQLAEPDPVC